MNLTNNIKYNSNKQLESNVTINNKECSTLIEALNEWVIVNGNSTYSSWKEVNGTYPIFDWQ